MRSLTCGVEGLCSVFKHLVETGLLEWETASCWQPESTGPSVFGYKSCPFPLAMAWDVVGHELLVTLNKFGEAKMVTFSPFHLRCCCDSQALVTPTPAARRWRKGGVLPVTWHSGTTLAGCHSLPESAEEWGLPSSNLAVSSGWDDSDPPPAPARCFVLCPEQWVPDSSGCTFERSFVCFYRDTREPGTCVCVCVCAQNVVIH